MIDQINDHHYQKKLKGHDQATSPNMWGSLMESQPHSGCGNCKRPFFGYNSPSRVRHKKAASNTTETGRFSSTPAWFTDHDTCTRFEDIKDELFQLTLDPRIENFHQAGTPMVLQDTLLYCQLYQSFDPEFIPKLRQVNPAVRFVITAAVAKAMSLLVSFPPGSVPPSVHEFLLQTWSTLQLLGERFGIELPVLDSMISTCQTRIPSFHAKEDLEESKKCLKRLQEAWRAVDRAVRAEQLAVNWLARRTQQQQQGNPPPNNPNNLSN